MCCVAASVVVCVAVRVAACVAVCVAAMVQGGKDSYDPLSCRSFSTKEPLNIGHFC